MGALECHTLTIVIDVFCEKAIPGRCGKLSPFPVSHISKEKINTIKANFELILN